MSKVKVVHIAVFGIGNVAVGLIMTLIGFKVYNPFKGKNEPEKEAQWYAKFGLFFKIGGIGILSYAIIVMLRYL